MALNHQQATPPAHVRFHEETARAQQTGPKRAVEASSSRAEVRPIQQVSTSTRTSALAASMHETTSRKYKSPSPKAHVSGKNPGRKSKTQSMHPKNYTRDRSTDEALANLNAKPEDEEVEDLDMVLGATVNSPAIARRKAREALAAEEQQADSPAKKEKKSIKTPDAVVDPDELIASIHSTLSTVKATKATPSQLQEVEFLARIDEDADTIAQLEADQAEQERARFSRLEAKYDKEIVNGRLETAFNALLNNQLEVADGIVAVLEQNHNFTPMN